MKTLVSAAMLLSFVIARAQRPGSRRISWRGAMGGGGSVIAATTACRRPVGLAGKPWRSFVRNEERIRASLGRALDFLAVQLLGFLVQFCF